jgi:hypothetical protein
MGAGFSFRAGLHLLTIRWQLLFPLSLVAAMAWYIRQVMHDGAAVLAVMSLVVAMFAMAAYSARRLKFIPVMLAGAVFVFSTYSRSDITLLNVPGAPRFVSRYSVGVWVDADNRARFEINERVPSSSACSVIREGGCLWVW